MPTVKLPSGKKRTFPYNAVGKAQAHAYAAMNHGKVKNNPGPKMEQRMSSSYQLWLLKKQSELKKSMELQRVNHVKKVQAKNLQLLKAEKNNGRKN